MNREGRATRTKTLPRPSQLATSPHQRITLGTPIMPHHYQKIDIIFSHFTAACLGLLLGLALLGVFDR